MLPRLSTETYRPIKVHIVIQTQRDDFFFKKRHVREPHAKGSVQFFFYKDRQIFFRVPRTTNAFPRIGHRIPLLEPPRSSAYPTAHCSACARPYPRFPSHVDAMLTPSHDSLAADTDAPYRARICHAGREICAPASRERRREGEQRRHASSRRLRHRPGAYHGLLPRHRQRQGMLHVPERHQSSGSLKKSVLRGAFSVSKH